MELVVRRHRRPAVSKSAVFGIALAISAQAASATSDIDFADRVPQRLRASLEAALHDEALDNAQVSFVVYDLDRGITLAESGADIPINPASNAKLITSATALHVLGPEYQWKTDYSFTSPLRNGVLSGDLVIKGRGDPTVVNERLESVADALVATGLERVRGHIVVDATAFDSHQEPKGWELEEAPDRAYSAGVSAVSLNFNAVAVHIRPGSYRGQAVVELNPPVAGIQLHNSTVTRRWTRRLRVGSRPDGMGGTTVEVRGHIGQRDRSRTIYRRVFNPESYFAATLQRLLEKRGVRFDRGERAISIGKTPKKARLVHVDLSPPLHQVIEKLNHYSNNFIAECIIKTLALETVGAPASFDAGLAIARRFLEEEVGFQPSSYVFENGSGLNDVNRISGRQVVDLLRFMHAHPTLGSEFIGSLAVAGERGTIGFRMRDGPAEGKLKAKTGTLRGVSALSGYVVDDENHRYVFSILVQGFRTRVSKIWRVQNRVGETLASRGTDRPVLDDAVSMATTKTK